MSAADPRDVSRGTFRLGAVDHTGMLVVPDGWKVVQSGIDGVAADRRDLRVILSVGVHDGEQWIHVSCSRQTRIPSWADLREVKELWLGDREAYMVFPASDRYVNIHPNVLHLWSARLAPDGVLPHFEGRLPDGRATI